VEHDLLTAKLEVSLEDLARPFGEMGLSPLSVHRISGGLLNSNFRVQVAQGPILLRVYPPSRDPGEIRFETEALDALAASPCRAPQTVAGGEIGELNGRPFVLLEFIEGRPLREEDIDDALCADAGRLLGTMHHAFDGFRPREHKPRNDVVYIAELADRTAHTLNGPDAAALRAAAEKVFGAVGGRCEWGPADSVVHGDYYVENLIREPTGGLAVVDFDDAYYGTAAFDLAIGAMEFATHPTQSLDPQRLDLFLEA